MRPAWASLRCQIARHDIVANEAFYRLTTSHQPHLACLGHQFVYLAVAAEMLNGEIEYRKGNYEEAFKHLRQSVFLTDNLLYSEPWAWMQPTRHALGALLLEQGHVAEAEQVYRADLGLDNTLLRGLQHRNNLPRLHGYVECLTLQGKHTEAAAAQARLKLAMAHADVPIHADCLPRRKIMLRLKQEVKSRQVPVGKYQ